MKSDLKWWPEEKKKCRKSAQKDPIITYGTRVPSGFSLLSTTPSCCPRSVQLGNLSFTGGAMYPLSLSFSSLSVSKCCSLSLSLPPSHTLNASTSNISRSGYFQHQQERNRMCVHEHICVCVCCQGALNPDDVCN